MSRLGKKPVEIPEKVSVEFKNGLLGIRGPCGELSKVINKEINIRLIDGYIYVEALGKSRRHNMLHGLIRGLVVNMTEGVTNGFKKELEVVGLGYRASVDNESKLVLSVGFSHLVNISIPATVKVISVLTPNKNTLITITGIDKYEVGAFAASVRAVKPPEPYKGFGIRYIGEKIIRKAGKAAAGLSKK
jgi:large subunit ribosomal protein L6